MTKDDIIRLYDMIPLDKEGGMWKAMFRSDEALPEGVLPGRECPHMLYGSILYLLSGSSVSRMHRLPTDEIWHFYMGAHVELLILRPDGTGYKEKLGHDIAAGEKITALAPRGCWQGARIIHSYDVQSADNNMQSSAASVADTLAGGTSSECGWALLGTTMAPAYEDCDYEDGTESLLAEYPEFAAAITPLLARPE